MQRQDDSAAVRIERKEAEQALRRSGTWFAGQKDAFQAAIDGAPLEISLGILIRTAIEQAKDDRRCAFYCVGPDATTLHHVVGMTDAYARFVNGFKIGSESLACGLAVATGQPIITRDVEEEPLWKPWLWLARGHGFRGCWSFPVETSAGRIVGTFAMYFKEPREPTTLDRELIESLAHSASIIISHYQEAQARKQHEKHQKALMAELDHRVKNVLARVASIAESTRQGSKSVDEFMRSLKGRIQAMATAHSLLSQSSWQNIGLQALVCAQLAPYTTKENTTIRGTDVKLTAAAAQAIAMVLHELATNAGKHGALSIADGHVSITWDCKTDAAAALRLRLVWRELGGPPVVPSTQSSYGTELIRNLIPHELGGNVDLVLAPDGACCSIEIPLKQGEQLGGEL